MAEKFNSIICEWSDEEGAVLFDPVFADQLRRRYGLFSLQAGENPDDPAQIVHRINGVINKTPLQARLQEVDGKMVVAAPIQVASALPTRENDGNVGLGKKLVTAFQLMANYAQEAV